MAASTGGRNGYWNVGITSRSRNSNHSKNARMFTNFLKVSNHSIRDGRAFDMLAIREFRDVRKASKLDAVLN